MKVGRHAGRIGHPVLNKVGMNVGHGSNTDFHGSTQNTIRADPCFIRGWCFFPPICWSRGGEIRNRKLFPHYGDRQRDDIPAVGVRADRGEGRGMGDVAGWAAGSRDGDGTAGESGRDGDFPGRSESMTFVPFVRGDYDRDSPGGIRFGFRLGA